MIKHTLAYLDPGTGSYLFQLLIAAVTAIIFYLALIKKKIKSVFRKLTKSKTEEKELND